MSRPDDYEEEMRRLRALSDRDIEQLFAGDAPAASELFDDLAAHLQSVRAALIEGPDEVTSALHVAEIAQTARLLADEGEPAATPASNAHGPAPQASRLPKWRRRIQVARSFTTKLVAAVAAAMLSTVGLAYAGVDLPGEAAEQAFEALGVHLPNQGEDGGNDVGAFASNHEGERDCRFGQAVADRADDASEDVRQDGDADRPDPCEQADEDNATGDAKSAGGRATADQAITGGLTTGRDASTQGRSTADDASSGASSIGEDASSRGASTAGDASDGKSSTGSDASQSGQDRNPSSGSDSGKAPGDSASQSGQENNPTGQGRP